MTPEEKNAVKMVLKDLQKQVVEIWADLDQVQAWVYAQAEKLVALNGLIDKKIKEV